MFQFIFDRNRLLMVLLVLLWSTVANAQVEPLLKDLPPGLVVDSSTIVPAAQLRAIGQKLGGTIQSLSNSQVRVHGAPIQVNVITAIDEQQAAAIHESLKKIKQFPFVVAQQNLVVEYVGQNVDEALAKKTSWELGLIEKPVSVRYKISADLATVSQADYMSCNVLFNHFLVLKRGANPQVAQEIRALAKKFTFGKTLVLRNPKLDGETCKHQFSPTPLETKSTSATITYTFGELVAQHDVPMVTVTMEIDVNDNGLRIGALEPQTLQPNRYWPSNDAQIVALAKQITSGKTTNEAKAQAILEWLTPGKNVKYSGQTGSRWGTQKVLAQKFGHCWDFSDCFVTLARAAGVPSRQVAGWLYGSSGHVWAEYYVDGRGWQQVDPTGGGQLTCGIYHIPYFTSEDGEMPIVYGAMPQIQILDTKSK